MKTTEKVVCVNKHKNKILLWQNIVDTQNNVSYNTISLLNYQHYYQDLYSVYFA